ncbi:MAG: hypothetical protein CYPHOPRED_002810 [Cyphobasidiales sp. Tagirdzhanova-0007]|nr:MAG: hypothetical protein CYPHOPRED_002810 [Cyphobasidiales sp. Tagirdzhanova-0007]
MNYYMDKHMPMVSERFGLHGLKSWKGGKEGRYQVQTDLIFGSGDDVDAAFTNEGEHVLGDIPNFTTAEPLRLVGQPVGESK